MLRLPSPKAQAVRKCRGNRVTLEVFQVLQWPVQSSFCTVLLVSTWANPAFTPPSPLFSQSDHLELLVPTGLCGWRGSLLIFTIQFLSPLMVPLPQ